MLETMEIRSNTIEKLKKIYEGKSFSDRIVVITELFQNSYRAKAKNIRINLMENILTFKDNGCGCNDPGNILTLDQSNWKTTDEGFGIGLWSWLAVPDVKSIEIRSDNWKAIIDVETIFIKNNPIATIKKSEKIKGFVVKIVSDYFSENRYEIMGRIKQDGELQSSNVYLNDELIEHKNLQEGVKGDFIKDFRNNLFEARLAIEAYNYPDVYYENRKVGKIYNASYIDGIIEMKKGALTLQEPDRKNIIYDNKKVVFENKLLECRKELYKDFIKTADEKEIDKYAEVISNILEVKDYEKIIFIDDIEDILTDEIRSISMTSNIDTKYKAIEALKKTIVRNNESNQLSILDNNTNFQDVKKITGLLNITNDSNEEKWIVTDQIAKHEKEIEIEEISVETIKELEEIAIGGRIYKKANIEKELENFELEDEETKDSILITAKKTKKRNDSLSNIIKKTNKKVWIKANEIEEHQELIARAEYYGIKVFIAKNILYENIFNEHKVPYITEVKDGIRKKNFVKNVRINTKKEQYYLEILQPILEYFDLPNNTFLIGNLKMYIETILNNTVVHREIIENKKGHIKICGLTDGNKIILDRRSIALQRFNFNDNKTFGLNECKALLATVDTIAHELAHLIYKTEDNTKEHFQRESEIKKEIINLYLTF